MSIAKSSLEQALIKERDIDLVQHLKVIGRYKWRILIFSALVTFVVAFVLMHMKPFYQATATLLIESKQAKAISIDDVYGYDFSRQEYLQTQFEILKSRQLKERVVNSMELLVHPEFNELSQFAMFKATIVDWFDAARHWLAPQQAMAQSSVATSPGGDKFADELLNILDEQNDRYASTLGEGSDHKALVLQDFSQRLNISPVNNTQLVRISFYAHQPELAAAVANAMGEAYIESHMDAKLSMAQKASDWLSSRLDELQIGLRQSERRLQAFREQAGLIDIDGKVGLVSREMNDLTEQLMLSKKRRDESKALLELVERRGRSNADMLDAMSTISGHRMIQEVKKAEIGAAGEVAELSKRYGPKHSKMIAAQAQLAEVRSNLRSQIGKLVSGIEQEYLAAKSNTEALERQMADVKERYQNQHRRESEYQQYVREVDSNRRIYETFLNRMKETGAIADFDAANARFTDYAVAPLYPAKPKKKLIVLATLLLTLLMGVAAALIHQSFADTITSSEQVEDKLASRLLGTVPKQKASKLNAKYFFSKKAYAFAESWRTIRTAYLLTHLDDKAKTICMTSTVPGEGKTTSALNLSLALSQMENVLLIEADLRRPSLGNVIGLPNYQPGLSNLVTGTHDLSACVVKVEGSELNVIPAGSPVSNPQELIASKAFKENLDKLKETYDRIIIDSAPVDVVSDALLLSRMADSIVYVVRSGKVRRELIQRSLTKLFSVKARVDGVVLNGVAENKSQDRSYLQYYDPRKA
ncbi:polysaccharide biosynthesis tyrosine autokinase [Neiella marina]|uniref:non-specific protein-tyrosine kinase n=1 Tax=Neiella holothuriorum TaxID=2870530 RepID=A0ABS7EGH8_9GAMM|nr:polysaccharide biosynthesis tyrosine autokinase [Neiella holothuriorum]MBW8191446.1 polysaccharide biosynthesis tyrosine autokinase [Neiella holothuriorum]